MLLRGAVPVMMREASKNLFRIGLYQPILGQIHNAEEEGGAAPVWKRMVAGAASGAVGAIVCNPFEITRIRVQAQALPRLDSVAGGGGGSSGGGGGAASKKSMGPKKVASLILQNEGMSGFYKAGTASVALGMVCTSVNLTTYTLFHEMAVHKFGMDDGPLADTSCALVSGFLAALAMNPVDVIRTRLMTQSSTSPQYNGILDAGRKIVANEGFQALFKGFMPSFLRVGPHFVLTFLLLEQMRRYARPYNAEVARTAYLTSMFHAIDADDSGEIWRDELFDALMEADPAHDKAKAKEETDRIFDLADEDNSGGIDLEEFLGAARTSGLDSLLRGRQLLAAFQSIDLDGNGTIDEEELLEALRGMRKDAPGKDAPPKAHEKYERNLRLDVAKIMDEVDEDGDRTIDFGEFARAYDKMGELEDHRLFEKALLGAGVALGE